MRHLEGATGDVIIVTPRKCNGNSCIENLKPKLENYKPKFTNGLKRVDRRVSKAEYSLRGHMTLKTKRKSKYEKIKRASEK